MSPTHRTIAVGAILAALAVALGAFGAHALKEMLEQTQRIAVYETANKYHFYHAFALLLLGIAPKPPQQAWLRWIELLFITGTVIFSGSLYLLCLTGIT
jgi:uncharacterized membrane protein YgdD (TMEM256/DUF423 family)